VDVDIVGADFKVYLGGSVLKRGQWKGTSTFVDVHVDFVDVDVDIRGPTSKKSVSWDVLVLQENERRSDVPFLVQTSWKHPFVYFNCV
jgi:hypothetical protein